MLMNVNGKKKKQQQQQQKKTKQKHVNIKDTFNIIGSCIFKCQTTFNNVTYTKHCVIRFGSGVAVKDTSKTTAETYVALKKIAVVFLFKAYRGLRKSKSMILNVWSFKSDTSDLLYLSTSHVSCITSVV